MKSALAILFCLVTFAQEGNSLSSSSMRRTYSEEVAVDDPECDGAGLRSRLGQNQAVFSCKPRFNRFTQQMEYPKCRVECASIAPGDPAVSKRYICKKNKGKWIERSHRTSINCSRPLVISSDDRLFLFQGRRRNFERRDLDLVQVNVASIFPQNAKATRTLFNLSDSYSSQVYVLLDDSSLVSYNSETNEFDGITLPTAGGATVAQIGGRNTDEVSYVYSIGATIFLKMINLNTLVNWDITSFTEPDGAEILKLNLEAMGNDFFFMYTTAQKSRISAYRSKDQSFDHFGYFPPYNGCEIVLAAFEGSRAPTTCGQLIFDFSNQFAIGTQNASDPIPYTVNTLGQPLSDWNSLIHVAFIMRPF